MVTFVSIYLVHPKILDSSLLFSLIGAVLALAYFSSQQSLAEKRYARDLFHDFNKRYKSINNDLSDIISTHPKELTKDHKKSLDDYFNLCAEEWLMYAEGAINPRVWTSWLMGMRFYYQDERIKEYWDSELLSGSYYDFSPDLLIKK
jgi:hypothetical protein